MAEELTHEEGIFGKTEILDEIKAEIEAAQKAEEEKKEGDAAGEDGEAKDAEEPKEEEAQPAEGVPEVDDRRVAERTFGSMKDYMMA